MHNFNVKIENDAYYDGYNSYKPKNPGSIDTKI